MRRLAGSLFLVTLALWLAVLSVVGCANIFARESDVSRETRATRQRCEAAAKAAQDTTDVCRAFLVP